MNGLRRLLEIRARMKYAHLLLVALLHFGHSSAFCSEYPARTVERFYGWAIPDRLARESDGLAPARQFLGQELFSALEAQARYEAACAQMTPKDMKGHMIEEHPFFPALDGYGSLVSTKAAIKGDSARVQARFRSIESPNEWTDTVVLRRDGDRWRIFNIEWQGVKSLTERLVDFSSYRCEPL